MSSTTIVKQGMIILLLTMLLVITMIPFYATMLLSQKTNAEIYTSFWSFPETFRPDYFIDAFEPLASYMKNSLIVSLVTVLGVLFLSSLSGYVFARMEFAGKRVLFALLLGLMMIPGILTLIPSFLWIKRFPLAGGNDIWGMGGQGFLNSWWALWLPYWAGGQVFGIFLCRTFFETLPRSLFEAARMDGASEFYIYRAIAIPLSLPILATLAIMQFFGTYNDYIWPLVTISSRAHQVFAVGIMRFSFEGNLDMGPAMAGYLIGSLPLVIIFMFGMRYYVQGITAGALKA